MKTLAMVTGLVTAAAVMTMGCAVSTAGEGGEPDEAPIGVTQQALVSLTLRNDIESDASHPTSNLVTDGAYGLGCGFIGWCGDYQAFFTGTIQLPALKLESNDGEADDGRAKIIWGPVTIPQDGDYVLRTGTTLYVDLSTHVRADSFLLLFETALANAMIEYTAKVDGTSVWYANRLIASDSTTNDDRIKTTRGRYTVPTDIPIRGARAGQQVRFETALKMRTSTQGNGTLARVSVRKFGLEANLASQPVGRLEQ
jgi:hypothetical protein